MEILDLTGASNISPTGERGADGVSGPWRVARRSAAQENRTPKNRKSWLCGGKLRASICFAVLGMLLPCGLMAQTASPTALLLLGQAALSSPSGQIQFPLVRETSPGKWLSYSWDNRVIFSDDIFPINQHRAWGEAASISPSKPLFGQSECKKITHGYTPSLLYCPPFEPLSRFHQEFSVGTSYLSGPAFTLDLYHSRSYLLARLQPDDGEQIASPDGLPTTLGGQKAKAISRADPPGVDASHSKIEHRDDMAFVMAAPPSGRRRHVTRDKVALLILSLAVPAAVTWDAQSTKNV
jgi:hypothetical protein